MVILIKEEHMRHMLTCVAIALLVSVVGTSVYAAAFDTCYMSVTVSVAKDVTITNKSLAFPAVSAGTGNAVVSTAGCTVTNTGSTTESYNLQLTAYPAGWTVLEAAGNPAAEQMKLLALFTSSNPPAAGSFSDAAAEDVVKQTGTTNASGTVYALNTEGASVQGFNCTASAARQLWFKFIAPSATVLTTQQWLTVTVTAY
jgi:hypothetical protein